MSQSIIPTLAKYPNPYTSFLTHYNTILLYYSVYNFPSTQSINPFDSFCYPHTYTSQFTHQNSLLLYNPIYYCPINHLDIFPKPYNPVYYPPLPNHYTSTLTYHNPPYYSITQSFSSILYTLIFVKPLLPILLPSITQNKRYQGY